MSNVVSLRARRTSTFPHPPETVGTSAELACLVSGLRSKAQEEISNSILMLDLAAQHAYQIAERISDPAAQRKFYADIATVERMLKSARDMALKL